MVGILSENRYRDLPSYTNRRERDFVSALKQCTKTKNIEGGKKLHLEAVSAGCHTDKYVAAALVNMYRKCGSMQCAREVFDRTIHRNAVAWNSLLLGYVENGESYTALELFTKMDCKPTNITYIAVVKAYAGLVSEGVLEKHVCLEKGIAIHKQITERAFDTDLYVASTLVDMYGKCGCMERAKKVFDGMPEKDVVTWHCLLLGYVENGQSTVAMELFTKLDFEPNSYTYVALIKACAGLGCLEKGIAVHKRARDSGFDSSIVVGNALIDMYGKCGCMKHAQDVFDGVLLKDAITWTSLIQGYAENGEYPKALELFSGMDCEPTFVTYVAAIKACAGLAKTQKQFCLEKGIAIHEHVKHRGFDSMSVVECTLIDMYGKCGNMQRAKEVFDKMTHKDVVTWNCLLTGYAENECSVALDLFSEMDCEPDSSTYVTVIRACACLATERQPEKHLYLKKGASIHESARESRLDRNTAVANTLIDLYGKCGCMQSAREVFEGIESKNVVTWNCLLIRYVENGESSLAMELFTKMDCEPDGFTYVAVLKAFINLGSLTAGELVYGNVCKLGLDRDQVIAGTMVDLYTKCGGIEKAENLLNSMDSPDIVSWTALMAGYSLVGDSNQVFSMGRQIQELGLHMNAVTFTCILTACSHVGLVEEGRKCFECMSMYGVSPCVEHYNCIVDMLCRANRLEEALLVMEGMPFEGSSVTWTTLLGACRKWKNVDVGKVAFDALVTRNIGVSSAYVLMGEI